MPTLLPSLEKMRQYKNKIISETHFLYVISILWVSIIIPLIFFSFMTHVPFFSLRTLFLLLLLHKMFHECFSWVNPKSSKAILMFFPCKRKPQEYQAFPVWHVIVRNALVYTQERTCTVHYRGRSLINSGRGRGELQIKNNLWALSGPWEKVTIGWSL